MAKWIKPGSRIVDVGCGSGRLSAEASKYGPVLGVDLIDEFKPHPGVEFRLCDAREIKEEFDVAIMSHVLEHIDDPVELLSNLNAETILIEVPNFDHDGRNTYRAALGLPFDTDFDHVREYSLTELTDQLDQSGWEVKELVVNDAISLAAVRAMPTVAE